MPRSPRSIAPCSFPKSARLLARAEFLAAREKGRSFAEGPLAASWRPRDARGAPSRTGAVAAWARVGLTVSSKVGPAVVRNRVKRRLREAVRRELGGLPAVDLVLVARGGAVEASVEDLQQWLRKAARRMHSAMSRSP